jgi:hypothetical protein
LNKTNQRNSPVFSPASVALSLLVLSILGIALWVSGGTVFNPGPVTAKSMPGIELESYRSHADFETQCQLCHLPFETEQAGQCLKCHTDIRAQLEKNDGLHGQLSQPRACATCHQEHRGRDFDPSMTALSSFDHTHTRFPLTGKHGTLACQKCHTDQTYSIANTQCAACHKEPPAHAGLFSTDCASCHTTFGWRPAQFANQPFDHRTARFTLARHTLDYNSAAMPCTACHSDSRQMTFDAQPCSSCHATHDQPFMQKHVQLYGSDCLACHDGVDRLHGFDHQVVFPLKDKHNLQCDSCHKNKQFRGTSPSCAACHQEPAIHAGFFGQRCDYCHTLQGWRPALFKSHTFPLDHGGKGEVDCKTCHTTSYAANRCDTCHEHAADLTARSHAKLNLTPVELANCIQCHLDGKVKK